MSATLPLQKTLARNGLVVQTLALTSSSAAEPRANYACNSGSFGGTCIGESLLFLSVQHVSKILTAKGSIGNWHELDLTSE